MTRGRGQARKRRSARAPLAPRGRSALCRSPTGRSSYVPPLLMGVLKQHAHDSGEELGDVEHRLERAMHRLAASVLVHRYWHLTDATATRAAAFNRMLSDHLLHSPSLPLCFL